MTLLVGALVGAAVAGVLFLLLDRPVARSASLTGEVEGGGPRSWSGVYPFGAAEPGTDQRHP